MPVSYLRKQTVDVILTYFSENKKGDAKDQAFLRGGISSCRGHCKQHWEVYKQRCEAKNIALRTDAMPPKVLAEFRRVEAEEAAAARGDVAGAGTLDSHLTKQLGPREFTVEGALENVAKYITCCDKVSPCIYWMNTTHLIAF